MPATKLAAKSFQAPLERMRSRLNWVIVPIPFDVYATWGKRGQIRVKGEINGFAFGTSLFPTGSGGHYLLVNKGMQKGGKASVGTVAKFRLEPDTEKRVITIPEELEGFLAEDRSLRRWYDKLNPSTRNDIAKWISDVKSGEARVRRAEQIMERLLSTMEAERELPPLIRLAFARDAQAMEGWKRMSLSHRRAHLMAIFYYRNPAARARRLAKTIEAARQIAERRTRT